MMCPDGHFRCVVFGLGSYIADYPEQVWLTGIVSTWCPKYVVCSRVKTLQGLGRLSMSVVAVGSRVQ